MVVTARPSYSRVKTAMKALQEREDVELQVVVAASALLERYGSAVDIIRADGFPIAATVLNVLEGEDPRSMAKTTGLGVIEMATVLDAIRPEVVVSIADRFETMATAVAASYMNLPLCHIQGGEVTGSIDEKVRHAVTKLADLHLVSHDRARERVVRMGENPQSVYVTGCPSIDLAAEVLAEGHKARNFRHRYRGVGTEQELDNGYLIVLQHPVTNEYEASFQQVTETLHAVRDFGVPALWFWPNVDAGSDGTSKGIRVFRENEAPSNIQFYKNMEPEDFLHLLRNSIGILGNSSVAIREGSFLGVPAIDVGSRQSGRDRGSNVRSVGYDRTAISQALREWLPSCPRSPDFLYGDGKAGPRIAELLATLPLRSEKCLAY